MPINLKTHIQMQSKIMKKRQRKIRLIRAGIQLLFFIFAPALFSTAFAGVKSVFQAIAAHQAISWNSFLDVTAVLLVVTCLFGRHFCGYACAFGSLGDALYELTVFIRQKVFHKKGRHGYSEKAIRILQKVKYIWLLVLLVSILTGWYSKLQGMSPWDVFSMLTAGRLPGAAYKVGIVLLLLITVLFNLFLTRSGEVLWQWWIFTITAGGLNTAVYMGIRLIYLIIGSSLMTFTTTPNALTDGIEELLDPLKKIHVPVHEVAMMMSIALRFIPILLEETDKIMKAQIARGADLESGNIIQRAKSMIPILVPLFVSAFRRANDLAMAMESRCYRGGEGRTKMKPLRYHKRDYIAYIVVIIYVIAVFVIGRYVSLRVWVF